jgi:hypothetical protein
VGIQASLSSVCTNNYIVFELQRVKKLKIRICKAIILPVVLYGCETWSLTLRKEHTLRVFENRVVRRIFGPKRDEVMGEWIKLHNKELHDCTLRQV